MFDLWFLHSSAVREAPSDHINIYRPSPDNVTSVQVEGGGGI